MRLVTAITCAALAFSVTPPAMAYNVAPGLGIEVAVTDIQARLGTSFANSPACVIRVLATGVQPDPSDPMQIDSITCLNEMCTMREVVLCSNVD